MSGTFVLTLLFLVVAVGVLLASGAAQPALKRVLRLVAFGAFALTALCLVLSTFTVVPTRDIGIVTSFGKPVGNLDNGIHAKLPWEKVKTLDGAIQTDSYLERNSDGCTEIRIGNESTACVDNSIRWRIKLEAGETLYQDYRDMDNIRRSLVTRELTAALNEVLSDYNPLSQIQDDSANATGPNLNEFSRQVAEKLRAQVGDQIDVKNVIIPLIHFDKPTQSKINLYQAEVANTRIAQQREKTATAQGRANDKLKSSVSNNPNVLVSQCLDTFSEMVKEGQTIPIGFSCWPGGSASSVVIPQK
ncbi:SPFH domain-containing protein [Aeromicrobium sp. SMF47]|uniref:SPFH domain-containing protein n=1 Tax=Aeromicrobium TaxID=2040 RepID=UPI00129DC095|nr:MULTISPECIES: SPFH domain-containing protein [Aeromicrobium]MRJ76989.1 SPFH domain-containing protein [Aeromicrobium yanjiei]MRK01333.1 SPFH domain-containing protein [Aeromicrobium sp. S22]